MERAVMGSVRVTSSVALSTLKSQCHETVKFGEVHWFGKKGERAVSESLFHRFHEQTPRDEDDGGWAMKGTQVLEEQDGVREVDTPCRRIRTGPHGPEHMET